MEAGARVEGAETGEGLEEEVEGDNHLGEEGGEEVGGVAAKEGRKTWEGRHRSPVTCVASSSYKGNAHSETNAGEARWCTGTIIACCAKQCYATGRARIILHEAHVATVIMRRAFRLTHHGRHATDSFTEHHT